MVMNIAALLVTKHATTVTTEVISALEQGAVWGVTLLTFYAGARESVVGEPWSRFSWVQAIRFALVILGNLLWSRFRRSSAETVREPAEAVRGDV